MSDVPDDNDVPYSVYSHLKLANFHTWLKQYVNKLKVLRAQQKIWMLKIKSVYIYIIGGSLLIAKFLEMQQDVK